MIRLRQALLTGATIGAFLTTATAIPSAVASFPGKNGDIAFTRRTQGQSDIWLVDSQSGSTSRLTNTPKRNEGMPDWNAEGTTIAYSRCGRGELANCDIWIVDANGSGSTRLTKTAVAQETWPTWSPDGTMVAYVSNADDVAMDIWVMNADGTGQTNLTPDNEAFDAFPEWSPDGSSIVFSSNLDNPNDADDSWLMGPDGTGRTRLTASLNIDERPDWSPDGAQITFTRNGDVMTLDSERESKTKLMKTRRWEVAPTFSPNGRRIAFMRPDKKDRYGIWTIRADGEKRRRLTSGKFDAFPDWQPVTNSPGN